jgi:hypothetical protein
MNKTNYRSTDLVCLSCGNVTQIVRRKDNLKLSGHIKDLWCYKCKIETKHYEVRDVKTFILNHQNQDRISKEEQIVMDYLLEREDSYGKRPSVSKKVLTKK